MAASEAPARVVERHADEAGDRRLRRHRHDRRRRRVHRPRGAHRHVRQRRHAVGREADADPARLHAAALRAMAEADPSLREQQPFKASYEHDFGWLGQAMVKHYQGDDGDLGLLMARRFPGPSPTSRSSSTARWSTSSSARGRTSQARPPVPLVRLPADGRAAAVPRGQRASSRYIASGGDRDFMRPIAGDLYGIPPERVIGSSLAIEYREGDDDSSRRPLQERDGVLRRRADEAGADLEPHRTPPGDRRRELQRRRPDAALRQVRHAARAAHCSCCTTTPSASSTTPPAPRRPSSGRGAPAGP